MRKFSIWWRHHGNRLWPETNLKEACVTFKSTLYSAVPLWQGQFSTKSSQKAVHSSPVRARCGLPFVYTKPDLYSASVTKMMYAVSWFIGLCYNGTWLHMPMGNKLFVCLYYQCGVQQFTHVLISKHFIYIYVVYNCTVIQKRQISIYIYIYFIHSNLDVLRESACQNIPLIISQEENLSAERLHI